MIDLLYVTLAVGGFLVFAAAVRAPASACEVPAMIEYLIGGAIALALLAYLTAALLRPERF